MISCSVFQIKKTSVAAGVIAVNLQRVELFVVVEKGKLLG